MMTAALADEMLRWAYVASDRPLLLLAALGLFGAAAAGLVGLWWRDHRTIAHVRRGRGAGRALPSFRP